VSVYTRREVTRLAWERGLLSYKLRPYQLPLYDALYLALNDSTCVKYVLNCARRYGKSTILCLIALETAIRTPRAQVRFAAPTARALKKITQPIFQMLIGDCPDDLRPYYRVQEQVWVFPNGSEIHLAGTDNGNAENLRGTASHLNLVDEAGFVDELDYIVRSILMPQTLDTGGKTLLASTPPKTPAHDFFNIAQECRLEGHYSQFTIWDNKSLDQKTIDTYAKESGGLESTTFKREYLCEFIVDEKSSIIPEWKDEYARDTERDEFYPYYHKYVAMDLGVKDFTATLYGYYDFPKATLHIEDESTMSGPEMTTPKLSLSVLSKESELWGEGTKPYIRIADNNNPLLLQDLGSLHNLHFRATNKDSLDAMVNEVRILVGEGRLVVSPKCKKLIACLKYGVWDNQRKKFARTLALGHFDHLAALIYLVRNLDTYTNPIPALYNTSHSTHFLPNRGTLQSGSAQVIGQLFSTRRSS
jgi:hypothetical protein